jgi:hypothetical protein
VDKSRIAALAVVSALLVAGCTKPPELMLQRLSPDAPAAQGFPAPPLDGQPTPLGDRPPFGLYANYPSNDTLKQLSTGTLSPDGRFRFAFTQQGVWITRLDGAWLWQVPLPGEGKTAPSGPAVSQLPPGTSVATKPPTPPVTPPAVKATKYIGPGDWTPQGTLLLRDETGVWIEAAPATTYVTPLPQPLQGKESISFSPDGKQVLYYTPGKTGRQLWQAAADGAAPTLLGENLTGYWGKDGKPQMQKNTVVQPGSSTKQDLAPGLRFGPDRQ